MDEDESRGARFCTMVYAGGGLLSSYLFTLTKVRAVSSVSFHHHDGQVKKG